MIAARVLCMQQNTKPLSLIFFQFSQRIPCERKRAVRFPLLCFDFSFLFRLCLCLRLYRSCILFAARFSVFVATLFTTLLSLLSLSLTWFLLGAPFLAGFVGLFLIFVLEVSTFPPCFWVEVVAYESVEQPLHLLLLPWITVYPTLHHS